MLVRGTVRPLINLNLECERTVQPLVNFNMECEHTVRSLKKEKQRVLL